MTDHARSTCIALDDATLRHKMQEALSFALPFDVTLKGSQERYIIDRICDVLSGAKQVVWESSRDEPNPPPPVADAEIGELVERLGERWEKMDGAAARKINRILQQRREALDTIRTLQARVAEVEAELRTAKMMG